jgi:flagellar biosynthesis protein FlhG
VAHRTKIGSTRLDQIEKEMFDRLPAAVYLRGFVLEYAKALGISQPQEVAAVYLARYHEQVANP